MSEISLKSITGITSITTPTGVDNQLTVHNNNTTEAVKFDNAGNVHINNQLEVAGVSTFSGGIGSTITIAAGVGSTAITLDNSHKITFGSAHELEMFHDGSTSYIKQRGIAYPSRLKIISENSGIDIMSGNGGGNNHGAYENAISCDNNGKVKIYHAGVGPALETNGDGVTVPASIWLGAYLKHQGDLDTRIGFPAGDTITAETAGSERVRITSSGTIGIGTDNPVSGAAGARLAVHFDDNTSYAGGTARGNGIIVYNRNAGGHSSLELAQRNSANTYGTVILNAVDPADGNNYGADFTIQTRATGSGNYGERLRITSAGDLLLGGHSSYTYDDTGSSNVILDIYGGATAGKRGILSLSGRVGSDDGDLGTIWFNNDNNSGASPGNNMKLTAAIQAKSVTSDNNAQNDSGAYLQFFTKAESGSVTEKLRISSQGYVTKAAHPSFYARRSIGGDGRSSASPVTEWVNPGSETSGSPIHNRGGHFNHTTGLFTAPVNGIYHFSAAAGYKQTNNSFNQKFRINGVNIAEGCRFVGTPPNSHSTSTISATMYMAAGDTMGVVIETTHHVNTTFNYFSGHLVA